MTSEGRGPSPRLYDHEVQSLRSAATLLLASLDGWRESGDKDYLHGAVSHGVTVNAWTDRLRRAVWPPETAPARTPPEESR